MKKVALVFAAAVLAPSLLLAWLAAASLQDQQAIVERQETLLCQAAADALAGNMLSRLAAQQQIFGRTVEELLTSGAPAEMAREFDHRLRQSWGLAQLGFCVSLQGEVLSPLPWDNLQAKRFRLENDRFLCNRETVEVVWQSPKGKVNLGNLEDSGKEKGVFATKGGGSGEDGSTRKPAQFRQIVGDAHEGTLARFLQDKLNLLFWYRSTRETNLIFGAQVDISKLLGEIKGAVRLEPPLASGFAAALRDDGGKVLASFPAGFSTDWKHPFVYTELGEGLPHWDVAISPLDPNRLKHSAAAAQWNLGLLIATLVVGILTGGWLILSDLRREMRLARQKTDFVSNVSHELKTPLTSIRMFSEMLADGRADSAAKQMEYARIIAGEAGRLTRLINNVLEFARADRNETKYRFERCDLRKIAQGVLETYRPQLESKGFKIRFETDENRSVVLGDEDALAQILLNLFSNAEKYAASGKELAVEVFAHGTTVEVTVCDRGEGIPAGSEEKIFEKFYRAHDSLASGIQGTGLGLTLARQIARAHGGELNHRRREGGGSCFTLTLNLA